MKTTACGRGVLLWCTATAVVLAPAPVLACAACYGASDAPMAQGMNWGIFSLLGVILTVLGGVAAFFISLARRAAKASNPAVTARAPLPEGALRAEPAPVN